MSSGKGFECLTQKLYDLSPVYAKLKLLPPNNVAVPSKIAPLFILQTPYVMFVLVSVIEPTESDALPLLSSSFQYAIMLSINAIN
jgi:hypothetical protein